LCLGVVGGGNDTGEESDPPGYRLALAVSLVENYRFGVIVVCLCNKVGWVGEQRAKV